MDMLLWNEVALQRHLQKESSVITGFPWGVANLPVNQVGLWAGCAGLCLLGMLNQSRGAFWFVHKPPPQWTLLQRAWGRCDARVPRAHALTLWEPTEAVVKAERALNVTPSVLREGVPEGLLFYDRGR